MARVRIGFDVIAMETVALSSKKSASQSPTVDPSSRRRSSNTLNLSKAFSKLVASVHNS